MAQRIRVGILFGGKSVEHEVSVRSAKNILDAIDQEKYEPVLVGIDTAGQWHLVDPEQLLSLETLEAGAESIVILALEGEGRVVLLDADAREIALDVVFPILHGRFGEDGAVQGLLQVAGVPFVGAGVLGSAVGMDKDVMKRLLRDAGLPIVNFLVCRKSSVPSYDEVENTLGVPFFVKPANSGSSVGVSKVHSVGEFEAALADAFLYDGKVILEQAMVGREIECAVLGNSDPIVSIPGEVISHQDFYSYDAKYVDADGATIEIPANISSDTATRIQELALSVFQVLETAGLGRVDFFLTENDEVVVNEINTLPGFTSISMYPKLFEASGISYTELIDRLITLAFERFAEESELKAIR